MKFNISDSDLLSIDDNTGDIVIGALLLPAEVKENDTVTIHYLEDPESIEHSYVVTSIDEATCSLHWLEQLGESLLTEANPIDAIKNKINNVKEKNKSLDKQINKSFKAQEKQDEKTKNNTGKLIARDMGVEGRNWKFYIQKPDGSYTDALSQDDVKKYYVEMKGTGKLLPSIANAFVTTNSNFLVRRGLEDLYRTGTRLNSDEATIGSGYYVPVPSNNYKLKISKQSDTSSNNEKQTQTNQTNSVEPAKDSSKTTQNTTKKSNRIYISKAMLDKFKKLANATGLQVVDSTGAAVDITKLNIKNIANHTVKSNGKQANLVGWLRAAVKEGILTEMLNEANITLTPDEMNDPKSFSLRDKIDAAMEQERIDKANAEIEKKSRELQEKNNYVVDELNSRLHSNETVTHTLEYLFDKLVPSSGAAETVAGEYVRAIMRILYRDYNDGDKFFEGYGLETCGSSAEYLFDEEFSAVATILDDCYRLTDNDGEYTEAIESLGQDVVNRIAKNPELLWTINETDSRDYPYDYIEENQPRYEFEVYASYDVVRLIEHGVIDAWQLHSYVEEQLERESVFEDCEVNRPFSYGSTSIDVSNLTKDGYDRLEKMFKDPDRFWEDLVQEYGDQIPEEDEDYEEFDDNYEESSSEE